MTATPAQFKDWVNKYTERKNTPPDDGTVFTAEEGRKIRFVYDAKQDLLSCNLDIDTENIVDADGNIINPDWRLVYEDSKTHNGLRVIIVGAEKALYLQWKDNVTVSGIKINNVSRTKKSVLGELILAA